jgi:transposase
MIKTANRKGLPLHLTEQERETLLHQTKATSRTVADRARLLLALDAGQNSIELAKQTGLHPVTIRHLKRAFQRNRLSALKTGKRTGRRPHKRQAVEAFVEQQSQRGMLQSPDEGILSVAVLRRKLLEEQQISVCINTVRNALKKRGLVTVDQDIA